MRAASTHGLAHGLASPDTAPRPSQTPARAPPPAYAKEEWQIGASSEIEVLFTTDPGLSSHPFRA